MNLETRLLRGLPSDDFVAGQSAASVLTRGQLRRAVAQCARRLSSTHGVGFGDRVAGLCLNGAPSLVILLALARLRAVWVPLNWRLAPTELGRILDHCTPVLLVADRHWLELATALVVDRSLVVAPIEPICEAGGAMDNMEPNALAQDPVLLVYTSGTTGEPKAALHTQGNLVANVDAAIDACDISPADRVLTSLPMFHVGGLCIHTLPALAAGARVMLHERFDAGAVIDCLNRAQISLLLVVPATLQALVSHPSWSTADLSQLRAVWAGSSIVPRALIEAVGDRGVPVCNVYGSTETGPVSVVLRPAEALLRAGSSGWPALGVALKLINAKPADGEGQVGEIALRAPNIAQTYWPNQPSVDIDGFFHTGDVAHVAADGCVTIIGRSKELIISGGENIHPAEVEAVLGEHPWVAECAVFGVADAQWGEVVEAAVVLVRPEQLENTGFSSDIGTWSPDSLHLLLSKTELSLMSFLQTKLAKYKCPKRIHVLTELPKTALGKVQKQRLAQQMSRIESA